MNKYITNDYGWKFVNRRFYLNALQVIAGFTGRTECLAVGEYFCEETNLWWAIGVWADSPESGPRLTWAM